MIKNSDNLPEKRIKYSNDLNNMSQKHAHQHPRTLFNYMARVIILGNAHENHKIPEEE